LTGAGRISELSLFKAQAAVAALRDEELGTETINHYIRAIKGFSRWLRKDGRAREHILADLATSSSEADRRHPRRALTPEEATRLIQAVESGPVVKGLSGSVRAMAYRVAVGTGFRADELRSLTTQSFRLDQSPPTIVCEAAYTKNGQRAEQPVADSLASLLRPFLAMLTPDRPVFGLPEKTAEMLQVDLASAGIAYEADEGFVDFHALRTTYVSHLMASGASVKTCQILARHSTPTLTIGISAKASLRDIKGAVESLPDLTPTGSTPEAARMTGTDATRPARSGSDLTAQGQRAGDVSGRILSLNGGDDDVSTESSPVRSMGRDTGKMQGFDASCRELSAPGVAHCERRDSNPHVFRHRNLNPLSHRWQASVPLGVPSHQRVAM
jgi:integrase